jgi:glycosyltransferase involved in cell wall biosynthesis
VIGGARAPLVTVGIAFFDEERYLASAIRSVLAQTMRDFELLLVDDGSTDGSLSIARSFDDSRITVLSDGRRRHLPARLNEIVGRARAPLVARMDGDDLMHPARLERQLDVMRADPSYDIVSTWAALADGDGPFATIETARVPPTPASALTAPLVAHATVLGRRAWFLENAYDERLTRCEDRDLWCRTSATIRVSTIPECLYVVRISADDREFLRGYLDGQRQLRRVYARYGPRAIGVPRTARLVGATYAKNIAIRVLAAVGLEGRLIRRRGRSMTDAERSCALEAYAAVQRP